METEYLQAIEKHTEGRQGTRGVDTIAQLFTLLVDTMDITPANILGDFFQGRFDRAVDAGELALLIEKRDIIVELTLMAT